MISSFFRVQTLDVTESTNLVVKEAALAGEAEGLVVQALRQTAGKGRLGRTWESPEGNLYASVLVRPHCPLEKALFYNFAAALAVHDALMALHPSASLQLKWPNDVLEKGRKISGVLLEAAPVEDGLVDWLVLGVGINVAHHPEQPLYPATSLAALGVSVEVSDVLSSFLKELHRWIQTLKYDGFCPLRKAWLSDAKAGAVTVKTPTETIEGVFAGIDQSGALILRLADGAERVIYAGDVFCG